MNTLTQLHYLLNQTILCLVIYVKFVAGETIKPMEVSIYVLLQIETIWGSHDISLHILAENKLHARTHSIRLSALSNMLYYQLILQCVAYYGGPAVSF